MRSSAPAPKTALLLGIVAGLLVCAAGVALASAFLPEWRAGEPADESLFRERYRQLAARAGFILEPGEPRLFLTTGAKQGFETYRPQGDDAAARMLALRSGYRVEVFHGVRGPRPRPDGRFGVDFSLAGQPLLLSWWGRTMNPFAPQDPEANNRFAESLANLLLRPGESLGPARRGQVINFTRLAVPLEGSRPPQHLLVFAGEAITVGRRDGEVTEESEAGLEATINRTFAPFLAGILAFFLILALFIVLAMKARLSVINGAFLALAALLTLIPAPTIASGWLGWTLVVAAWSAARIFFLWSSAESLLRSTDVGFTTSLDALRAGRIGPRGGRALLIGFGFGAGLGGLHLALLSLAEALPGFWPTAPSLHLPLFNALGSLLVDGIRLAGGVALALALAYRILPLRWAPPAAAIAAGILLSPLAIHPFLAQLALDAGIAGLLVFVARRHGLTALLVASVVSHLLPAAAFSARHLDWMAGGFAVTTGLSAAVVLLGFLGLSRSAAAEIDRLSPPGFVRRLEEERRLGHEMDLLARMQRGLLPRTLPRIEGYETAARSVLANEAGGDLYDVLRDEEGYVWVAAGDVAGHGYSCAIAQAMAKASLASLIGRGRSSAEVLQRMDRVFRAAGLQRNFTTLALLRLNPGTGEGLLSNAGHPYALLAAGGEVEEIAIPSLPLGQGPPRHYEDRAVRLAPEAVLVFCSDGLFEAADGDDSPYGYERARTVLRVAGGRSAEKILEALLADWRHHLRASRPLDDTTVVVLRRGGGR